MHIVLSCFASMKYNLISVKIDASSINNNSMIVRGN